MYNKINWCWLCQKYCEYTNNLNGQCTRDPYSLGCIPQIYQDNKTTITSLDYSTNTTTVTNME